MKRLLCLLLSAVLVCSLAACGSAEPTTEPTAEPTEDPLALTGQIRSRIEAALGRSVDFDSGDYRYYGTYNGYTVLYRKYTNSGSIPLSIGDYIFADTDGVACLYAISDGEYTRLQYIYEAGGITDDQLSQIYKIHRGYYTDYMQVYQDAAAELDEPVVPLTYEIEKAVDAALYAIEGRHIGVIEEPYRYYGQFNGYYVLFQSTQASADMPFTAGKYVFHHDMSHVIWVIGKTEKKGLPDAYACGWITDADLDAIYRIHVAHYTDAQREDWFTWTDTGADLPGIWELAYYVNSESHNHREVLTELPEHLPNMKPYQTIQFDADGTGILTNQDGTQVAFTWEVTGQTGTKLVIGSTGLWGGFYEIGADKEDYRSICFDIASGYTMVMKKIS